MSLLLNHLVFQIVVGVSHRHKFNRSFKNSSSPLKGDHLDIKISKNNPTQACQVWRDSGRLRRGSTSPSIIVEEDFHFDRLLIIFLIKQKWPTTRSKVWGTGGQSQYDNDMLGLDHFSINYLCVTFHDSIQADSAMAVAKRQLPPCDSHVILTRMAW